MLILLAFVATFTIKVQAQVPYKTLTAHMIPEYVEPYPGVYQYFLEYEQGKFAFAWTLNRFIYKRVYDHIMLNETDPENVYSVDLNGPVIEEITVKQFVKLYEEELREELKGVVATIDSLKGDKDSKAKQMLKQFKKRKKELNHKHKKYVKELKKDLLHRRNQGSIFVHNTDFYWIEVGDIEKEKKSPKKAGHPARPIGKRVSRPGS